jgi:hypothetical protein
MLPMSFVDLAGAALALERSAQTTCRSLYLQSFIGKPTPTMSTASSNLPSQRPPISDKAKITLGIAGGLLCVGMILYGLLKPNDAQPQVTRAEYRAALQKWKDAGIKDYDMRLTLSGRGDQNTEMILEVRNGVVTKCLKNGRPEAKKVEDNWTVDNQFKYIEEDLDKAAVPGGFGVKQGVYITLHAEFDPKYGYPDHYFRQAHGPSPLQSQSKVQSFKVVEPGK